MGGGKLSRREFARFRKTANGKTKLITRVQRRALTPSQLPAFWKFDGELSVKMLLRFCNISEQRKFSDLNFNNLKYQ